MLRFVGLKSALSTRSAKLRFIKSCQIKEIFSVKDDSSSKLRRLLSVPDITWCTSFKMPTRSAASIRLHGIVCALTFSSGFSFLFCKCDLQQCIPSEIKTPHRKKISTLASAGTKASLFIFT